MTPTDKARFISIMSGRLASFFGNVLKIFQRPFHGLPAVMWVYFVFAYIALPMNPIWMGDYPDPDDVTYLQQTIDWLQGQAWFDNVQRRMSPPEGVAIHFTRFAQIPIAAVILAFRALGYTWQGAAMLGSFLLPLIYLGVLFWALRKVAQRYVDASWARLVAFVALFCSLLTFKYAPGQVDHHGLLCILTITSVGLATFMFEHPRRLRWALASSAVLGLTLAIGLEVLPWVVLVTALVGFWALVEGKSAAKSAMYFGTGLFASGSICLLLTRHMSEILTIDLLSFSIVYVILMAGAALALGFAALLSKITSAHLRIVSGTCFGSALGGLYLYTFPELMAGPYGAMDQKLASLFFANLEEAIPLFKRFGLIKGMLTVSVPLLGLATSLALCKTHQGHKRWSWALMSLLLAAGIALMCFYQIRFLIYAQLFSIIPLVAFIENAWPWVANAYAGRKRYWAEIGLVMAIGPLMTVIIPGALDGRSFNVGVLMFPAQRTGDPCSIHSVRNVLTSPPYEKQKLRILSTINQGAELLFFTPHEVLAAPYHTNVSGNLDAIDFFSSSDFDRSKEIAKRREIDLVLLCRSVPDMYLKGDGPHYVSMPNGLMRMRPNESLAGHLVANRLPDWIVEVPIKHKTNFSLFEVRIK